MVLGVMGGKMCTQNQMYMLHFNRRRMQKKKKKKTSLRTDKGSRHMREKIYDQEHVTKNRRWCHKWKLFMTGLQRVT